MRTEAAFTLIELLVVIAIIAILAVVVVLTLNPAELLRQSRDSNRLSDLSTISDAVNLYNTDQGGNSSYTLGVASDTYLSILDPTATSTTSGNQCSGIGVASAPGTYSYHCSASSTYRNINATGWIPVNFSTLSAGSPISSLPIDPINQTSSDLYYTYQTNGSLYKITAFMESSKYAKAGIMDGGTDPTVAESGSGVAAIPDVGRGLIGDWPLNEGAGGAAIDWGGGMNNGTWGGTQAGSSTYYGSGNNVFQWSGYFNGTNDYVSGAGLVSFGSSANGTILAWIKPSSLPATQTILRQGLLGQCYSYAASLRGSTLYSGDTNGDFLLGGTIATGTWQQIAVVFTPSGSQGFVNGAAVGSNADGPTNCSSAQNYFAIGVQGYNASSALFFSGSMSDVRVYARALSSGEIQQIYNAEK